MIKGQRRWKPLRKVEKIYSFFRIGVRTRRVPVSDLFLPFSVVIDAFLNPANLPSLFIRLYFKWNSLSILEKGRIKIKNLQRSYNNELIKYKVKVIKLD